MHGSHHSHPHGHGRPSRRTLCLHASADVDELARVWPGSNLVVVTLVGGTRCVARTAVPWPLVLTLAPQLLSGGGGGGGAAWGGASPASGGMGMPVSAGSASQGGSRGPSAWGAAGGGGGGAGGFVAGSKAASSSNLREAHHYLARTPSTADQLREQQLLKWVHGWPVPCLGCLSSVGCALPCRLCRVCVCMRPPFT